METALEGVFLIFIMFGYNLRVFIKLLFLD